MPLDTVKQAKEQASYINQLLENAREIALSLPDDELVFDPQEILFYMVPMD